MKKPWFAGCLIAASAIGCAGPTGPAMNGGFAAAGAPGVVATTQPTSWTDKFVSSLKHNPVTDMFSDTGAVKQPPAPPTEFPFDPKSATPELYVTLAQMSHRAGDVEQARRHYQQALALDPKNIDALLGAARMEDREGRLDVALMLYKRAAAAHPRSAAAQNDLAICYARRGDLPTAVQALEQAVRLEPRKALYRNNVAKVLVEMNQLQPAMAHLAAVHTPAATNYNMAVLLNQRGRDAESIPYLSQALALDPTMEPAQAMMARLTTPVAPISETSIAAAAQPTPYEAPEIDDASILPTPEAVATAPTTPWTTPTIGDAPAIGSNQPEPSEQTPVLLPPVN